MKPRASDVRPAWFPVDGDAWADLVSELASIRPLTPREAAHDLRYLARNGGIPGRIALAARWGWSDDGGPSRARRLVADGRGWKDTLLDNYLDKYGISGRTMRVEQERLRGRAERIRAS